MKVAPKNGILYLYYLKEDAKGAETMKRSRHTHGRAVLLILLTMCLISSLFGCADRPIVDYESKLNFLTTTGVSIFRVVCAQDEYPPEIMEAAVRVQRTME